MTRYWSGKLVGRPPKPLRERLARLLKEVDSGCVEWQGFRDKDGYGRITIMEDGKARCRIVPRIIWELANGPIPEGKQMRHSCDNPPCAKLEHLLLGDPDENSADMVSRGRSLKGESNPSAKITKEIAQQIRESKESYRRIAKWAGVSNVQVRNIKKGFSWA